LDLLKISKDFDSFEATVELEASKDDLLTGLVGWFEIEMTYEKWLSTAPDQPPTHWKQVFFPITGNPKVTPNEKIKLWLEYSPAPEDHRGM